MTDIVINASSLIPLLWAFALGIILGCIVVYPMAQKKGYEKAIEEKKQEVTAQAFTQYLQSLTQGGFHGSSSTKE